MKESKNYVQVKSLAQLKREMNRGVVLEVVGNCKNACNGDTLIVVSASKTKMVIVCAEKVNDGTYNGSVDHVDLRYNKASQWIFRGDTCAAYSDAEHEKIIISFKILQGVDMGADLDAAEEALIKIRENERIQAAYASETAHHEAAEASKKGESTVYKKAKKVSDVLSVEEISQWMISDNIHIHKVAEKAYEEYYIPVDILSDWIDSENWNIRYAAMVACRGRSDIPLEILEKGLHDKQPIVRFQAALACEGCYIPIGILENWMDSKDWRIRYAAMVACRGREDIPFEFLAKGLRDYDSNVNLAASSAFKGRNVPTSRTFEPPEQVYKKCLGDVIVVAEIPKDAHIRGSKNGKCRASKAIIRKVIGSINGKNIGISNHDKMTVYCEGDEIEIEDFDMGYSECSDGFHFFCTLEQSEKY